MTTIVPIFRKNKVNKDGYAPIYFRITKNRKSKLISSGIKIRTQDWDDRKKRIKSSYPNSARANSILTTKLAELQDESLKLETANQEMTAGQLKDKVFGKKAMSYFEVAQKLLETYLEKGNHGTYDKCTSMLNKHKEFAKNSDIHFQDITPEYLERYERYLRVVKGNKINTIAGNLRFIRRVFNYAIRYDVITDIVNPFKRYSIKTEKTTRVFLTEDELADIQNLELPEGERIDLHRDMFIFSSYAGGIRISDLLLMKWKQFDGTHIEYTSKKTTYQVAIKLPNVALEIVRKYQKEYVEGDCFLFPMLNNELDVNNAKAVDLAITKASAYVNKNLVIIAKKANLSKHISSHIARHTWATRALRKGVPIEKVAKILGHSDLRQVLVYAKIVNKDLDDAMDRFNA